MPQPGLHQRGDPAQRHERRHQPARQRRRLVQRAPVDEDLAAAGEQELGADDDVPLFEVEAGVADQFEGLVPLAAHLVQDQQVGLEAAADAQAGAVHPQPPRGGQVLLDPAGDTGPPVDVGHQLVQGELHRR